MTDDVLSFLSRLNPFDELPEAARRDVAAKSERFDVAAGEKVYGFGERLRGLFVVVSGTIAVSDRHGTPVSLLERENSFGERGLLRDGFAVTSVKADADAGLICVPTELFHALCKEYETFRQFFNRTRNDTGPAGTAKLSLASVRVETLMVPDPVTCTAQTGIQDAARLMRKHRISCLCVVEGKTLTGILTVRDLSGKAMAEGLSYDTPVSQIMTHDPRVLPPSAIGTDVLHLMMEYRIGHLPIVLSGRLVGIVTQTDLTRFQAASSAGLVSAASRATSVAELSEVTARIPDMLVQLLAAGNRHDVVTRMITDVADVVTRCMLRQAEEKFGPPPVRYLWLACGSQGRQEQTGVSDQDNCLILEDHSGDTAKEYFRSFARFVSDGLNACGYVYCPGDMMATNPRWCQPLSVWRDYFAGWIAQPGKEAQMLSSVMFDLRPIGGDMSLFRQLQTDTLRAASENSIFTAHMAGNSLTHSTPLGLLRGLATIRSGEHRNTIDTKMNGVIPVVDLGRMYALQGRLTDVNTRARIEGALAANIVSQSGGRDLLDAYDLVAQTRLEHQAKLIKNGKVPDNFLPPAKLSGFDRSHLRDAFVVIKTMQAALMQGRGILG